MYSFDFQYSRGWLPKFFNIKLHIDWPLLLMVGITLGLGLIVLYSAKQEMQLIYNQFLRIGFATSIMLFTAHLSPRVFRSLAPWLYFTALGLLIIVLLIGHIGKGGQRWLDLGLLRFQPAELMKLALPMMIARYLEERLLPPRLSTLFLPVVFIITPVLLIAKQPDLGTAILILSSGLFVLFFAGLSLKIMLSLLGFAGVSMPLLWFFMYDYQKERVLTLLNPARDPLGSGYHIIQSKIALGSGGLYGKGWLNGTQSQLEFLPERATDSIFAVFGEEFGLVGCLILLLLYLSIIMRGLYISVQAQDTFSRLVSGSLIMTLFVYLFVNIGMVTGILPVVGIPLPLVSFGGTSLVTLMASFGILMSIHTHRTLLAK